MVLETSEDVEVELDRIVELELTELFCVFCSPKSANEIVSKKTSHVTFGSVDEQTNSNSSEESAAEWLMLPSV